MPSSQLKRAEKSVEAILSAGEPLQSQEVGLALQELLDAVRSMEQRVTTLEHDRRKPWTP